MKKKKILAIALVMIIAAMAVAGASLAYFTDTKTATNTFTMGNVKITLDEAKVDPATGLPVSGANRVTENAYQVYPGAEVSKDPTVHNVGQNDAYIRAKVEVSNWLKLVGVCYPDFEGEFPEESFYEALNLLVGELGEGWSVIGVEKAENEFDARFILKYDEVLAVGENTSAIFSKVIVPTALDNDSAEDFQSIKVKAEAIQATANFADWEAAFVAFDANN